MVYYKSKIDTYDPSYGHPKVSCSSYAIMLHHTPWEITKFSTRVLSTVIQNQILLSWTQSLKHYNSLIHNTTVIFEKKKKQKDSENETEC